MRPPARHVAAAVLATALLAALSPATRAAETPVALSELLGDEISRSERDAYHLFPDVPGFVSARIFKLDHDYRVDFTYEDKNGTTHASSRRIDQEAFDNTRRHVALVEAAQRERSGNASLDSRVLYGAALRLAADGRYDLSDSILDELQRDYPAQYDSLHAARVHEDVSSLLKARSGLFREGSAIDQSGRTDVMVFSGFYGVWLAIGIPIAFDVDSGEGFAAFLLTVPAASVYVAHLATKDKSVTNADAEMVSLGGWFGTWQGVGWSALADKESEDVVGIGVLGGLAGIGVACLVNSKTELSEGHAALMNSANWWGTWLGLLVGAGAQGNDDDGDNILASALVGSGALVAGTAALGGGTPLDQRRVRYMNLGGIVGAIFGGGVVLLAGMDDDGAVASTFAVSSLLGGYLGVHLSRPDESDQSRGHSPTEAELAAASTPRMRPFAGWSRAQSETRVGIEISF